MTYTLKNGVILVFTRDGSPAITSSKDNKVILELIEKFKIERVFK